jgi:hypothetical protein
VSRDEDVTLAKPAHEELAQVHKRIDALKEEVEQQHFTVVERLHSMELAIARGGRFPVAGWGVSATLLLAIAGAVVSQVTSNSEIRTDVRHLSSISERALTLIEDHIRTAGPFREGVKRWEEDVKELQQRVGHLEQTAVVNVRRLDQIEKRNEVADKNWDIVKSKGFMVQSPKP